MKNGAPFTIRPARHDDCGLIATLIRELAAFEKLEDQANSTADDIERYLFGPRPFAEAILVELGGEAVGFALFFHTFSTFRGRVGLYLEDAFIRPEYRRQGVGKQLMGFLARLAEERGCGRMEWSVLNWNTAAIGFYESLGAEPVTGWTVYRIADAQLARLAATAGTEPTDS